MLVQVFKGPSQIIRITQLRFHQLIQLATARLFNLVHETLCFSALYPPLGNPVVSMMIHMIYKGKGIYWMISICIELILPIRPLWCIMDQNLPRLERIIQPIKDDKVIGLEHTIGTKGAHGNNVRMGYNREEHGFDGHVDDTLGEKLFVRDDIGAEGL